MTNRSSVMTVIVLLVATVIASISAEDGTTIKYEKPSAISGQRIDTDASGDHRHGRMSLHAELPSSKAKREQALRNILAAKRRQIFSQRSEPPGTISSRALRSNENPQTDSSDILEAQETRHEIYVATPGSKTETSEDETSESSTKAINLNEMEYSNKNSELSKAIEESNNKQIKEKTVIAEKDSVLTADEIKLASRSSKNDYKNPSLSLLSSGGGLKNSEADGRKKNTVPMPESLYNHFRPVESNIPIEDMSQFLYFGQKLHPEVQNTTGNNSVEMTPAAPTALSSRRRSPMKRFSTTTALPVLQLEEIINEEMNIAVERQTVEKNKVSKIKNTFRNGNLYYRKSRPDSTIALNVIPEKEIANVTYEGKRNESILLEDKSVHTADQDRSTNQPLERGSSTHVVYLKETRNANESTQIPKLRPVSANSDEAESEIVSGQPTDFQKQTFTDVHAKVLRANDQESNKTNKDIEKEEKNSTSTKFGVTGTGSNDSKLVSKVNLGSGIDQRHSSMNSKESNNVITSRDAIDGSTKPGLTLVYTTRPETSTLRIVVTEESTRDFAIEAEFSDGNTVKPLDSAEERVRLSGNFPATVSHPRSATTDSLETAVGYTDRARHTVKKNQPQNQHESHQDQSRDPLGEHTKLSHRYQEQQPQQHTQQQHVYAYTITNVTRQLRNYTGPGLSLEELRGPGRGSGTSSEITSGSGRRRAPPSSSSSPQTFPRAGSGIEPTRAPAELSAGATVEPVTAGSAATADALVASSLADGASAVGERRRKPATGTPQQSHQRVPARTTYQAVNKTSTRNTRPLADHQARGTIRWNHTKPRNADLEASGDRRYLRKSASAVLNQRIGGPGVEEEIGLSPLIGTSNKRRRIISSWTQNTFPGYSRRPKGATAIKVTEDLIADQDRSVGVKRGNGSIVISERNRSAEKGSIGDGKREGNGDVPRFGGMIKEVEGEARENDDTMDSTMEESKKLSTVSTPAIETNRNDSSFSMFDNTTASLSIENVTVVSGESLMDREISRTESIDAKDDSVIQCVGCKSRENANKTANNVNETMISANNTLTAGATGATGAYEKDTLNVTTAKIIEESATVGTVSTTMNSTTTTTTTSSPPVFPVTPKMLTETTTASSKETFTLKSGETMTQPPDSNRPFGMNTVLDPSEIQRMYRQGNSSGNDQPITTTILPIIETNDNEQTNLPETTYQPEISSPISSSEGPRHSERSPEVRGRNLYDKSREKDDVLPIMHLYHTSDIFNGSSIINSVSRDTESPPIVELSTDKSLEDNHKDESRTEEVIDTTTTTRTTNESSNPSRVPPLSKETTSRTSTKKDRFDDNREFSSQDPTGPSKGSNLSNHSNNRTRHRPAYHHVFLPEYNGSLYPPEINRTFFETGLFSIGPRDPVNISEVISKRHDGDAIASQETVTIVSYILATLVVFPIAVGVGLILRRLIIRNRKVLEESDTSSEISCRKDALNLENGDFKTSIEKAITKLPRIQHLCHEAEKPPPPPTQESRWEFPRDKLRLQTVLGQGNFGQVWKAEADDLTGHQGTTRLVAVKTVKEGASEREKEDLVRELEIMQQLGSHPNVVTLLGCCTEEEPHYLILEYVMYGKLLAYLRDHRTRQDFYNFSEDSAALTSRDLTVFGYCVARGMEYLASKKIIHRDLAARNVLVDHNKLCKIADFGMSRFANEDGEVIETRHGRNALPIRWMAPESLIYSLFTTKTDVWSFGILMWEIVTLGSTPYPDMTAREVMRNVQSGYRLERPSHCRSELFRVISRCWHDDPDRRPEFQTLRRDLAQLLEDNMNGHYVDLESFASECTD